MPVTEWLVAPTTDEHISICCNCAVAMNSLGLGIIARICDSSDTGHLLPPASAKSIHAAGCHVPPLFLERLPPAPNNHLLKTAVPSRWACPPTLNERFSADDEAKSVGRGCKGTV